MERRHFILGTVSVIAMSTMPVRAATGRLARSRARPGLPGWPSAAQWQMFERQMSGALLKPVSPFAQCGDAAACDALFAGLRNPYRLGDDPALTQSLGWVGAWTSRTSPYAVAATSA